MAVRDEKVAGLEKELDDMRGAIRRLSETLSNTNSVVAKLSEEVNRLKVEVKQAQRTAEAATRPTGASIGRYE